MVNGPVCQLCNWSDAAGQRCSGLCNSEAIWWRAKPPTPSPTGTEMALEEAKRHIAVLTRFYMANPAWVKAADEARAFIADSPETPNAS